MSNPTLPQNDSDRQSPKFTVGQKVKVTRTDSLDQFRVWTVASVEYDPLTKSYQYGLTYRDEPTMWTIWSEFHLDPLGPSNALAPASNVAPKSLGKCDVFGCFETATVTDAKGNHYCEQHAPNVAPLTPVERDILQVIGIRPLPVRFADHLKPESLKAFERLRDNGLIKFYLWSDCYHISDAGRAALEDAEGGK